METEEGSVGNMYDGVNSVEPCPMPGADNRTVEEQTNWAIYRQYAYIMKGPVSCSFFIAGLLCNTVSLLVFIRAQNRPRIYEYLIALGLWNIALLISAFLLYMFPTLFYGHLPYMGVSYVYTYRYWYTLSNMTFIGSLWVVLTLTVERYFAFCHPLSHTKIGNHTWVKRSLRAVCLLAFCYGAPRFFEVEVGECWIVDSTIRTIPEIRPSSLYHSPLYQIGYKVVGGLLFYSAVPFMVLLALTVRIMLEMRRAWRIRWRMAIQKDGKQYRRQAEQSDIMMLAVIVKFLLSQTMPAALDMAETIVGEHQFSGSITAHFLVDLSNVLVVFNSMNDFFIYLICGRRFRRELGIMLSTRPKFWSPASSDLGRSIYAVERKRLMTVPSTTSNLKVLVDTRQERSH